MQSPRFYITLVIGLLIIPNIFLSNQVRAQHNGCFTPLQQVGECVSLKFCPQVVNLFTKLPQNHAKEYTLALQRSCGRRTTFDNYPIVCCTRIVDEQESTTTTTTTTTETTIERFYTNLSTTAKPMATDCRSPDLSPGLCKYLGNCTVLLERAIKNPDDESFKEYLRTSNKLCKSVHGHVCCPNELAVSTDLRQAVTSFVSESEGCGFVRHSLPKVVGGEISQIGAWPWVALIGYNAWSLAPFKCGGTLISARHVITAAHCIRSDLTFVRLGEFDLSVENETSHLDIMVNKIARHPDFARDGRHDLAILFLEKTVQFTELISPICMPTSTYLRAKSYVGSSPFVAGWGRTVEGGTTSNVLQQLQMPVLLNSECRQIYQQNKHLFTEQQFDNSVLCAGYLVGGKDTCQGDSGGPLMMPELYKGITRYYLIGVVSYGIGCARVGIPGVYTSTQYFIDWIAEKMADT